MRIKNRLPTLFILAGLNAGIYSTAIADTIKDAEQAIENKDYSTAIIHLKNQLKETPKDAHARFLLGGVYLSTGKLDASLKELGRAYDISPQDVTILFRYADALQVAGNSKKILKILNKPLEDKKQESQRLNYLAYASLSLQKLDDARKYFNQANTLNESANTYNGLAAIAMFEKDFTQAAQLINTSLSIEPDNSSTLQLKAKLANINQQHDDAIEIYNDLVAKSPDNLSYRLERAATLAVMNKSELSKVDLKVILDKYKNHPQANFIKAQLLLREKDFKGAQEAAQIVVNVAPSNMPAAFVLGAANFALKQYNQAEEYLTIYLSSNPGNLKAQNLLANVYLAQNQTKQALLILEGIPEELLNNDSLLLTTLGSTYIQEGETDIGIQVLRQAQTLDPENQNIRKRIIAAQFKSGELDTAISELEELAEIQTDSTQPQSKIQTNYLLIISYIKQKDLKKADDKIKQLLLETPDDLKLLNLKALILQLQGHSDKANAQYQAIIKIDKENIPAYMGLARIAALDSNWQAAEDYFKQVIKINPDELKAYIGLAALAEKQNNPQKAEEYFMDAFEQTKNNVSSQLTLAGLLSQWYQSKQQPEKILALAEKLDKQHPGNNKIRSFLARAQLLNKQNERAERTLKTILTFDKKDINHRIILAQIISRDDNRIQEAMELLDEAQLIQPENQALYTLKASLLIKQKKFEDAINLAKIMQEKFPNLSNGHLLEADIYRSEKKYKEALSIYQAAYKKGLETKASEKKVFSAIVDMLITLDQKDEAIIVLTEAVDQKAAGSDDVDTLFKLASLYHEKQQVKEAEIYYQRILDKNPKHVITLNNLAWIKIDSDIKQAVQLAKQAHEQAPKSGAIKDTYGYFLVRDVQYAQGLELLKEAAISIPEDKDIQYHLAFAYEKTGQRDKAQKILKGIIHAQPSFSEQEKAQQLYQEIK